MCSVHFSSVQSLSRVCYFCVIEISEAEERKKGREKEQKEAKFKIKGK